MALQHLLPISIPSFAFLFSFYIMNCFKTTIHVLVSDEKKKKLLQIQQGDFLEVSKSFLNRAQKRQFILECSILTYLNGSRPWLKLNFLMPRARDVAQLVMLPWQCRESWVQFAAPSEMGRMISDIKAKELASLGYMASSRTRWVHTETLHTNNDWGGGAKHV